MKFFCVDSHAPNKGNEILKCNRYMLVLLGVSIPNDPVCSQVYLSFPRRADIRGARGFSTAIL